jgi:hypothetical protein
MQARRALTIPCALIILAVLLLAVGVAGAGDPGSRQPYKVRSSDPDTARDRYSPYTVCSQRGASNWDVAAGQSRREILCPRRGYALAVGVRPFFTNLTGATKVLSRGSEGSFLHLQGFLRLPSEATQWEFFANLRTWDRVTWRLGYHPWNWTGVGHASSDGNFAGLWLRKDDAIQSDLDITSFIIGADYDVAFSRDLVFGPNADLHVIRWMQKVAKATGDGADFSQTILQPAIGAHIRYEPTNTGYFSWFKPYLEGRMSWMSFSGLRLSTWDVGAGVAPPVSRNLDAGIKAGYKQWKFDGNRNRLFADVGVEGFYLDFGLQF